MCLLLPSRDHDLVAAIAGLVFGSFCSTLPCYLDVLAVVRIEVFFSPFGFLLLRCIQSCGGSVSQGLIYRSDGGQLGWKL